MSKVAVSFTHIIKSAEPAFSVIIQRFFLGENFPLPVYLSLLPIIGGCGLAAATELNFNTTGIILPHYPKFVQLVCMDHHFDPNELQLRCDSLLITANLG
jgi:hypothetical protein